MTTKTFLTKATKKIGHEDKHTKVTKKFTCTTQRGALSVRRTASRHVPGWHADQVATAIEAASRSFTITPGGVAALELAGMTPTAVTTPSPTEPQVKEMTDEEGVRPLG